jgi:hypothetical protein
VALFLYQKVMFKPTFLQVVFTALALLFLFVLSTVQFQAGSVDIERVRLITPSTYFPPEIQVKHRNVGESPIRAVEHTVKYRSPMIDSTYWTRDIICRYDSLRPGEAYNSRCDWINENVPPTRSRVDRQPNAALFFTDTEVISDSTGT